MKNFIRILSSTILFASFVFAFGTGSAQTSSGNTQVAADLEKLYQRYPSMRTHTRRDAFQRAAKEVLGESRGQELVRFAESNTNEFQKIRAQVFQKAAIRTAMAGRSAVVSGQSVTGMIAAAVLARSGYQVDVYDVRDSYTRNIQWSGRQALLDQLSSIDPRLADEFIRRVSRPLERGSIHLNSDGTRRHYDQNLSRAPNPLNVPESTRSMLAEPSVVNMEAKEFEKLLREYVESQPNIRRHQGSITLTAPDSNGRYGVKNHGRPDLVVLAEGAGSSSREALAIESAATSPGRLQIAGVVHIESGGVMAKHWREEAGDVLITGTMGRNGSGKTWVVADIEPAKIEPSPQRFPKDSADYHREKQRLIDEEFKRLAADAMEIPLERVKAAKIEGAVEGRPIQAFTLQQKISRQATMGSNVLGFGDVVGNNHWSVGGGMQIGAVGHAERLKEYLHAVEKGVPPQRALQAYSSGVLGDTMAWGEIGLNDFYPNLSPSEAKRVYEDSIRLWREGKVESPQRALELMFPDQMQKKAKALQMGCKDILRRVLER